MNINQITCGNCGGSGRIVVWKIVSTDEETGIGTMQKEENVCQSCNGKGCTEYAIFSVDEAKAILKHCGLTTES
jgi:hypothetical protein